MPEHAPRRLAPAAAARRSGGKQAAGQPAHDAAAAPLETTVGQETTTEQENAGQETATETETAAGPSGRRRWISPPAWVISAALHAAGLLILGVLTFGAVQDSFESAIVAAVDSDSDELEIVEFELQELELQETVPLESVVPQPGAADFGEVALESQLVTTEIGVGAVQETTVGEIGLLFGSEGQGMSQAGLGEGVAYFFGVKTKGNRFVFVVDNSNSMSGGKFETAVTELKKTVARLGEQQKFYVIFFSDTAYPLFYPQPARDLVPATEENKRRLEYWLDTVQRCLRTQGREAMQLAFQLRPDAIYVLGDGAFTDDTAARLLDLPPGPITIHTLGFRMQARAEQDFKAIARRFQGKFTEVAVTPQMVQLSRQVNRPRNRTRNGVWGVKLPPGG